jgi:hypothetical protein
MVRANGGLGQGALGRGRQLCQRRALLWILLIGALRCLHAQSTPVPEAPQQAQPAVQPGTLSGTVTDSDGDAIPQAQVTLSGPGLPTRSMQADGEGWFSFIDLPPATYNLSVAYTGFMTASRAVAIHPGEDLETPDIILSVSAEMTVDVSPQAQYQRAEVEMKLEETQRLGGVIPNFYVTYDWHASPLTAGQKFRLAWRSIIDPANFALDAVIAGVEQANNSFAGFGQGAQGYGKRYGSTLADSTVGSVLGGAVFPVLLRQDPRYFYKGTGSVVSRTLYAFGTAFVCRGDNGKWQPNYSSVAGDIAAGAVSQIYYPDGNRSGGAEIVENGLLNAVEDGIGNLLQEFLFKKITPKSPPAHP